MKNFLIIIILSAFILGSSAAFCADLEFHIKIKDHRFEPNEITIPANQKFKLVIENLDKTLEEFESVDLKKEKLVGSGKTIVIPVSPLRPGEYRFFGDFHQKTAQGKIIAK